MQKDKVAKVPPVSVDDELKLSIINVGDKGDGVAKVDNFVVFVPGAKKGQEVNVRITRVLPKLAFATIVDNVDDWGYEDEKVMEETR